MKSLYKNPLRVYLILGLLALLGVYSGLKLPISLFPNSSQPQVYIYATYGNMTSSDFLNHFGARLEGSLLSLSSSSVEVEKVEASYNQSNLFYNVTFKWGSDPKQSLLELMNLVNSEANSWPSEIKDSLWVGPNNEDNGFFAASYYSSKISTQDLYKEIEPLLTPKLAGVSDAQSVFVWNPEQKEIQIVLKTEIMANLNLFPRDVESALLRALSGSNGGSLIVNGKNLSITAPSSLISVKDFNQIIITNSLGRNVKLSDIASVQLNVPISNTRIIKTSGAPSVLVYGTPRNGGNIKKMSEDIIAILKDIKPQLPDHIESKILVDPSEFIRSSIHNVMSEVILAAFLAVCVLFLFIGSFRNVITAAIEIPMSILLAFILMKLFNMNINLISLGGLALSAGMNVDASVVVMENIFRHFEQAKKNLNFEEKLALTLTAVEEVWLPVVASTTVSIVVFLPLILIQGLSSALLGDLAKAVVFSHGFSAIVALILVPTIRLQMIKNVEFLESKSPIESYIVKLENMYVRALEYFLKNSKLQLKTYLGLSLLLMGLLFFGIPRLPKELISKPDTDWIVLRLKTQGQSNIHQMESATNEIEAKIFSQFGNLIQYTFSQIYDTNGASIMARLKNKKEMEKALSAFDNFFKNTSQVKIFVDTFNPSEMKIPNPPSFRVSVRGKTLEEEFEAAKLVTDLLEEKALFSRVQSNPATEISESVSILPRYDFWPLLTKTSHPPQPEDLTDISRIASQGKKIGFLSSPSEVLSVVLRFPENRVQDLKDLESLPIGVDGKIIPFKALAEIRKEAGKPSVYRENQQRFFYVTGRLNQINKSSEKDLIEKASLIIKELKTKAILTIDDAKKELSSSLNELFFALGLSVLLILVTLIIQLNGFVNSLLVFVAVPLGFIGVLISLLVFQSTLCLNSLLGTILLNGIAVANSIILVDFLKRQVETGLGPLEAAVSVGRKRLRPILMTSLTTALGMLPIAFGFGEGGKILQPLGLSVVGGLWFSMLATLFIVPSLQVRYLKWKEK